MSSKDAEHWLISFSQLLTVEVSDSLLETLENNNPHQFWNKVRILSGYNSQFQLATVLLSLYFMVHSFFSLL